MKMQFKNNKKRSSLLKKINNFTEKPFIILSLIWIGLVVYEFVFGLNEGFEILIYILWFLFIVDFMVEFIIAPVKSEYLKNNIITAVALFIPALRVFRVFRLARGLRSVRILRTTNLARVLASINRSISTLKTAVQGRGIEYVALLTAIVTFAGAAGIYFFENALELERNGYQVPLDANIKNYGDALWFTAMIIVTIGSDYWPKTPEGRILTFILALYAFAVFGYITATIASIIIGKRN